MNEDLPAHDQHGDPPPTGTRPSAAREHPPRRPGKAMKITVAAAATIGALCGGAAIAAAATGTGAPPTTQAATNGGGSGSTTTTPTPRRVPGMWPRAHSGGFSGGAFAGGAFGLGSALGPVLHGEFTVQGPHGYETLLEQSGTVTAVSQTSGSVWSLTVKSADSVSYSYVVTSSTSVNGGVTGISDVRAADTVHVVAVVSAGTATAKTVVDTTRLRANGGTWAPPRPLTPPSAGSTAPTPQ